MERRKRGDKLFLFEGYLLCLTYKDLDKRL